MICKRRTPSYPTNSDSYAMRRKQSKMKLRWPRIGLPDNRRRLKRLLKRTSSIRLIDLTASIKIQ